MMNEFDKSNIDYKKIVLIFIALIIVIGSIIFVTTFFFGNKSTNKKPVNGNTPINTNGPALNITSREVSTLYTYISNCNSGSSYMRSNYFYTNKKVSISKMDTLQKARCAFQFININDLSPNNEEFYLLEATFNEAYAKLFGKEPFDKEAIVDSGLRIYMNRPNTENVYATVNYDSNLGVYRLRFDDNAPEVPRIPEFYSALVGANSFDGGIILKEKIIYVKDTSSGETYSYEVFKDPEHKYKLDGKKNLKRDEVKIDLSNYYNEASTITYVFKLDKNNTPYFFSSRIN